MSNFQVEIEIIVLALTLLVTVILQLRGMLIQRQLKAADMRIVFENRWHDLMKELSIIEKETDQLISNNKIEKAETIILDFYQRYWFLNMDQYEYWKTGFLDSNAFFHWLVFRREEWFLNSIKKDLTNCISYREGFFKSQKNLFNPEFVLFLNTLFKSPEGNHLMAIKSAINTLPKSQRLKAKYRLFFSRYNIR